MKPSDKVLALAGELSRAEQNEERSLNRVMSQVLVHTVRHEVPNEVLGDSKGGDALRYVRDACANHLARQLLKDTDFVVTPLRDTYPYPKDRWSTVFEAKLHTFTPAQLREFVRKILQADRNSTPINTTTPGDYSGFFKHRV